MVKDAQVKGLMRLMSTGTPLSTAAMKSGMSEPTARKYNKVGRLPSQIRAPHEWRTRPDPFIEVWAAEIEPILKDNPGLEAKTIFTALQEKLPGQFNDGQLRTLQRRFRHWRALYGQSQEVFFPQVHHPGELGSSDFTEMNSLKITIQSELFNHLLYHFVLTYSNWEAGTVCFTESFGKVYPKVYRMHYGNLAVRLSDIAQTVLVQLSIIFKTYVSLHNAINH